MTSPLQGLVWPLREAPAAVDALGRQRGWITSSTDARTRMPQDVLDDDAIGDWLESFVSTLGVDLETVDCRYEEVDSLLRNAGPALLRVGGEVPGLVALVTSSRTKATILDSSGDVHTVPMDALRSALVERIEAPIREWVEKSIRDAGGQSTARVMNALMRARLAGRVLTGAWMLRPDASGNVSAAFREVGLRSRGIRLALLFALAQVFGVFAWWMIGRGLLAGNFERSALVGWALALATSTWLRVQAQAAAGSLGIDLGAALRQRILQDILKLDPDKIRGEGAGALLGRVFEVDAFSAVSFGTGVLAVLAMIEVATAVVVLSQGAAGVLHTVFFLGWVGVVATLGWRYVQKRQLFSRARIRITNHLMEQMLGYRTRLAQQPEREWHVAEDAELSDYVRESEKMDRAQTTIETVGARFWLILAFLCLMPAFIWVAPSTTSLAVSVGGILVAASAFKHIVAGLLSLASGITAFDAINPILSASAQTGEPMGHALLQQWPTADASTASTPLLEVRDVTFRYPQRARSVLQGATFRLSRGDRVLLEGPSGGGKSTLAAILTGLRRPETGLVLLRGLDRHSVSPRAWRSLIATVPQFHDNHVFSATFAFNLLLGRNWPPSAADLQEAERVCELVGLSDVLQRMPSGLQQIIGSTGWQLSHGELSRLYIARALLQRSEVLLLDESFAALDPATLKSTMQSVIDSSETLIVIAHP